KRVRSTRSYFSRAHQTSIRRFVFAARATFNQHWFRFCKTILTLGGKRKSETEKLEHYLMSHFKTGHRNTCKLDLRSV
ncbi:PIPO, partial [Cassava brown streak virus]|uniref:PIPO n=1 Tax=Cassava brown streak virus TaxID=137758 RepID=UPI00029D9E57